MALLDRKPCPRCKVRTSSKHCSSSACIWMTCNKCVSGLNAYVVFSSSNHFVNEKSP